MFLSRLREWAIESKKLRDEAKPILDRAFELEEIIKKKRRELSERRLNVKYSSEALEDKNKELLEKLRDVQEARQCLQSSLRDLSPFAFLRLKHTLPAIGAGGAMSVILMNYHEGNLELKVPYYAFVGGIAVLMYASSVVSVLGSVSEVSGEIENCKRVIGKVEGMLNEQGYF